LAGWFIWLWVLGTGRMVKPRMAGQAAQMATFLGFILVRFI